MIQSFKELVKNRNVIHIPIYSMFNKVDNTIDLYCDGNVNRLLTIWSQYQNDYKSLMVFCPERNICKNFKWFATSCGSIYNFMLIEAKSICKHAGWQRSREFANELFEEWLNSELRKDALIIFEGQGLGFKLLDCGYQDLVYWCPVCSTETKTRSFMSNDREDNDKLFSSVNTTIVATKEQYDYVSKKLNDNQSLILSEQFIDRSLPFFSYNMDDALVNKIQTLEGKVVYLPFRLSDEGYQIWNVLDSIDLNDILNDRISIVCSNVNGSTIDIVWDLYSKNSSKYTKQELEQIFDKLILCPSDRNSYYSILDYCSNIIIPYFEDYEFIMHASVDEFVRNKISGKVCLTIDDFKKALEK